MSACITYFVGASELAPGQRLMKKKKKKGMLRTRAAKEVGSVWNLD